MPVKGKKTIVIAIPRMGGGGAERVVSILANYLAECEYNVYLLTLVSKESFYQLNEDVEVISAEYKINRKNKLYSLWSQFKNIIGSLLFLRKHIKEKKPYVVISFLIEMDILFYILKLSGCEFKQISSERNDPTRRNKYINILLRRVYLKADRFICQSEKIMEYYSYISNGEKILIPNPLVNSNIPKRNSDKVKKKIVTIGRLVKQKNLKLLVDSFSDIHLAFNEYTLEIYGEGPLRKELQSQINSLGLEDKITLMGSKKDVLECIKDSTLFIMTSNYEGFPNALVEAMAIGLPVISTDFFSGVANQIIKDRNGILVPVGDRKALTVAMVKILSDLKLQNIMSEENKKVLDNLNADKVLKKWVKVIEEIKE